MSNWDHMGQDLDKFINFMTNLIIIFCIMIILLVTLAIWKIIDLIIYMVS